MERQSVKAHSLDDVEPKTCVFCGQEFGGIRALRRNSITCSVRCATDYYAVRDLLTDEAYVKRAKARARYALKKPEKHTPELLRWAERVMSGEVVPDRRNARPVKGSRRYEAAKRAGILEEIGVNY